MKHSRNAPWPCLTNSLALLHTMIIAEGEGDSTTFICLRKCAFRVCVRESSESKQFIQAFKIIIHNSHFTYCLDLIFYLLPKFSQCMLEYTNASELFSFHPYMMTQPHISYSLLFVFPVVVCACHY